MASLSGEILFVNKAGRELLGISDFDGLALEKFHTEEGMKRAAIIREKGWWEGEGELRELRRMRVEYRGKPREVLEFAWSGPRIWGATAAMLLNLVRRLEATS